MVCETFGLSPKQSLSAHPCGQLRECSIAVASNKALCQPCRLLDLLDLLGLSCSPPSWWVVLACLADG